MGELIKEMERYGDLSTSFTLLDVAMVFFLSFILSLCVGWVYRATHRGVSYSQTFVHTLVLFGTVVAFIMLIIGSNIARAFTLVGALSVVRFRHAVKESRDIAFVFLVMAVGMACGTRFYMLAAFGTICLSCSVLMMTKLDLFAKVIRERILIVRVPSELKYDEVFAEVFRTFLDEFNLISLETVGEGQYQEAVYSVVLRPRAEADRFIEAVRAANGNNKVTLVLGQQEIDL
jgi:uncharacterized membrane protein YhiD involved in acid resistance